jgi:hypothetical protein
MLLLVFCAIAALVNMRWRRFGAHLGALNQLFARIALLARLAGIRLRASDTASQATAKVATYMPEQRQALVSLNEVYERARYGRPGTFGALPDLAAHWQRLRGTFVRLVLTRPWRRGPSAPAAARNRKG